MKGKVCVFGSFNLDIVAGMARFPQPGESLIARNSMMGAGGKGANQATAALRAGANAAVPPLSSSLRYPFALVIIASGSPASFATSMP